MRKIIRSCLDNRRRSHVVMLAWLMGLLPLQLFGDIRMEAGWTRGTAVGSDRIAVYGDVINDTEQAVRIVDLTMTGSARVMLHESVLENGRMRMRHVDGLVVAPQSRMRLEPMGLHLMVMGLERPLEVGALMRIVATDASGGINELLFRVQSLDSVSFEAD
ncbi:MAG: copper chaperone PCu(A)C [Gammaproteobacteria bacterium TMED182]|nr:MAG: copper chaperone PCu(A)C [Gammaproteobacteria bacterium TMED182]